jgi:hypothetical protein
MQETQIYKLPITVLIMTQNEELNIKYTLDSIVNKFSQIIVTDSFSEDQTVNICKGFPNVEVYSNKFEHWATQRNWMLQNCNIINDWVFFLDADESIDDLFFIELSKKFINKEDQITSFYLRKDLYFLGKKLKYAYSHPKIRLIFKKEGLLYHAEGAREYATLSGKSIEIKRGLIHYDRRSFDHWIKKHIRNADREKNLILENEKNKVKPNYLNIPFALKIRKFIRYNIWSKLPFGIRPVMYFIYRYLFKLGFLDGLAGFIFCINHALWYELLIDIKILEFKVND